MIITADAETYFDNDYNLSKMTTEAYVRDPRFKLHGYAIKIDDAPARWFTQVPEHIWQLIDQSPVLFHHAQFDGLIMSHHCDTRPALFLDTLSMARIAMPHHRHSLDALSKAFGLPGKQFQKLADVKGVRDPSPAQMQALGEMACDDADKTYEIFQRMKDYIPRDEFQIIDMTVRMFTEPVLRLDEPKLRVYHGQVVAQKEDTLAELGVTREDLQSADKFAAILRALGVDPPTKTSPKGNEIYAFAKTDDAMRDLLENEDDRVAAVAAARLGIKSTLNETRCERLLGMASRGPLPVYLRYAGAHTSRWSGGDKLNWQNFPRREKDGSDGQIRRSLLAPPGYKLVVGDCSQIECRVTNWLAGQWDVIERFRNKEDPYVGIASQFYGRTITKADQAERGTGKQLELSCGFGAGAETIQDTAKLGIYGPPVHLEMADATRARDLYRSTHPYVVRAWRQGDYYLDICQAKATAQNWGPCEVADGAIWLPNGIPLWYDTQRVGDEGEQWVLIRGRWHKYYGAKLFQNVVQALARVALSEAMLRIAARYRLINCTHDEVWVLAAVDDTEALPYVLSQLSHTPEWAPGLPLDAEGAEGERYSK